MNSQSIYELNVTEIKEVSGGFICGGACVLGAIVAGAGLFAGGVTIGQALK